MENNKPSNNSFGVFLLGVIVGAAIVFLLVTKKGKRILRIISEKGLENISDFLDEEGRAADLETYEEEEIASKKEATIREVAEERPKVRRFFKGISRRVN